MGRLLEQFGLGDKPESDFVGVRNQLGEIQSRLAKLETGVTQLRAEVAQSTYSVLVAETTPITSAIDEGMDDLNTIAQMPADDPDKAAVTRLTLKFIKRNLIEKPAQTELSKRITGEVGADSLIKAFSKAAKTRSPCCWTPLTSRQVQEVFDYYQSEESRLLLLRVEYWHVYPNDYPKHYVAGQIKTVEEQVGTPEGNGGPAAAGTQEALLKPAICCDILADTRTNLEWGYHDLPHRLSAREAEDWVRKYQFAGWRLPTVGEIRELIQGYPGWRGPNYSYVYWLSWLDKQAGGALTPLIKDTYIFGVWVTPFGGLSPCNGNKCSVLLGDNTVDSQVPPTGETNLLLLVRGGTKIYWW